MRVRVFEENKVKSGGEELLGASTPTWIDIEKPDEPTLMRLADRFGLHRLAVEDCLHLDQRPKLEEYPGHLFVVLQGFTCPGEDLSDVTMHELHFFLGPSWIISVHENAHQAVDTVAKRLEADPSILGRGPDFLLYALADAQVDLSFPLLDAYANEIDDLESRIFSDPRRGLIQRIFKLKRSLMLMRKVLSPQRDVVGLLARGSSLGVVSEKTNLYFRDVYDHLVRIYEQIDTNRDLLGNAMDAWLSVVANKTNDITKQLTILASLFMPLSFIVGFFGQNFDVLGQKGFFVTMLCLMGAVPLGMILWFRRKGWW